MSDPHQNDKYPGSSGGLIEAVKRSLVLALRDSVSGTTLSESDKVVTVDLEYPLREENYPGIWVQFSVSELKVAGIGHERFVDGALFREWSYAGRLTLTIVALTSIERDRISDFLITLFAFSRTPEGFQSLDPFVQRNLYERLVNNPHISLTVNSDELTSNGQTTTVGTPWDDSKICYEDSYSFNLVGQFQSMLKGESVTLSRIDIVPTMSYEVGEWL